MTISQVPTACPDCGTDLRLRALPGWKYSWLSLTLFAIAGMCSFLCFFYLMELASYPDVPLDKILTVLALFSGLLLGLLAWKLPRIRRIRCHQCGWRAKAVGGRERSGRQR